MSAFLPQVVEGAWRSDLEHIDQRLEPRLALAADGKQITKLAKVLNDLTRDTADPVAVAAVRKRLGEDHGISDELL